MQEAFRRADNSSEGKLTVDDYLKVTSDDSSALQYKNLNITDAKLAPQKLAPNLLLLTSPYSNSAIGNNVYRRGIFAHIYCLLVRGYHC